MNIIIELDDCCPNCQKTPVLLKIAAGEAIFACPECDFLIGFDLHGVLHDPRSLAAWKADSTSASKYPQN